VTRYPRTLEWWISVVRLAATAFVVGQVSYSSYNSTSDQQVAWELCIVLAFGSVVLFGLAAGRDRKWLSPVAMCFDFAILSAFALLYASQPGTPTRQLLLLPVVLGALRFGIVGGIVLAAAVVPIAIWFEWRANGSITWNNVWFQAGAGLILAILIGLLMRRIDIERRNVERRAEEAEALRDELGRRADLLDAANRCARALSASLNLDEAFGAFSRELQGLIPFERMAIVLAEDGVARVIATAGRHADEVMPPGTVLSLDRNLLAEIVANGQTVIRRDLDEAEYAEEPRLRALGIRCRVVAPLGVSGRTIGLISVGRTEVDAFSDHEIELMSLLGRLVAAAVQNIRAYESERRTVEELRRLSALRADFVSLVSHELRSPMAAVIGASRTLQERWRELRPDQRQAFLALIGDETSRLASLIADVLDTSRIEAGTFSFRFAEVDLATIVRDTVASASIGQDEIPIEAEVGQVDIVRGDADRLRQVVANLVDNAVKYSPVGTPVRLRLGQTDDSVMVAVSDSGPGIAVEDQVLIFEKFGRASGGGSKPGTGLGLFIARSIAEAHGGTLDVSSTPGRGATFTLRVPVDDYESGEPSQRGLEIERANALLPPDTVDAKRV
jgi:signal transduction histidine kinase